MKTTPGVSLKPVHSKNRSVLKLLTFWQVPATFSSMMKTLMTLILSILFGFEKTTDLALENLALRQQVAILKRDRVLGSDRVLASLGVVASLGESWSESWGRANQLTLHK